MPWVMAAFLFWLALRGKLAAYAGFATTPNATGGGFLKDVFGGFSIPINIVGGLKAALGLGSGGTAPTTDNPQGTGVAGTPGGLGRSTPAPGTAADQSPSWSNVQQTFARLGIGTAEAQRIAGLNKQAQGNTAGGAAGL